MHIIIDLCLLCLSNDKSLKSIFTKDSDDILIEKKLNYFMFEHVKLDPDISKHICLECLQNINFFYNYRQQCLQNIDKLNSYMYKLKYANVPNENNLKNALLDLKNTILSNREYIELLTTKNQKLDNAVDKTDSEATSTVNEAENVYSESVSDDFSFHLENYELPDDRFEIECKYIPSNSESAILAEPQTVNFELESQDISKTIENNEVQQKSDTTGDVIPTNVNANPNRPFKCTQCPRGFTTSSVLKRHVFLIHCSDKPFNCDQCHMKYADDEGLQKHILRAHDNPKPFPCEICSKRFRKPSDLRNHTFVHTGESPYQCAICYKKFASNSHLTTHLNRHVGTKKFSCHICTYSSANAADAKRHQMRHLPTTNAPSEHT